MMILNFALLILISFCTKAKAETPDTCDVGVDGCAWTCKRPLLKPGQATCLAVPGTPKSCKIGSSVNLCGTTCTCSKAPTTKTCKVGLEGCTWTCESPVLKPGQATCLALPVTPETCVIGSSQSTCGTTCKCTQEPKCTVGVDGCNWNCVTESPPPGMMQCMAYPATPSECYPGEISSMCGTTCTCNIGCGAS